MNIVGRIRSFFGREEPPRFDRGPLKNKPDGMAWIVGVPDECGSSQLNGRAVKTVRIGQYGCWVIDPPQQWTATANGYCGVIKTPVRRGDKPQTIAIADCCLEPWKDIPESDLIETDIDVPSSTKERA